MGTFFNQSKCSPKNRSPPRIPKRKRRRRGKKRPAAHSISPTERLHSIHPNGNPPRDSPPQMKESAKGFRCSDSEISDDGNERILNSFIPGVNSHYMKKEKSADWNSSETRCRSPVSRRSLEKQPNVSQQTALQSENGPKRDTSPQILKRRKRRQRKKRPAAKDVQKSTDQNLHKEKSSLNQILRVEKLTNCLRKMTHVWCKYDTEPKECYKKFPNWNDPCWSPTAPTPTDYESAYQSNFGNVESRLVQSSSAVTGVTISSAHTESS